MVVEVKPEITVLPVEEYPPIARKLYEAKQKISDPDNWCKNQSVAVTHTGKFQYCAAGALWFSKGGYSFNGEEEKEVTSKAHEYLCSALAEVTREVTVQAWNDIPERFHSEVMDLYDRAINRALAEGK